MKRKMKSIKDVGPYLNTGFQIITPILVGVYFGQRLDQGHDFPLWTLILSVSGIALGLFAFIYQALKIDKKRKDDK